MKAKLSPTQEKVIQRARKEFREAISCSTLEEFYNLYQKKYYGQATLEELKDQWPETYELVKGVYHDRRRGILLTHASGPTIRKLEKLGLIRILEDATGTGSYTFDQIQLIV